MNTPRVTPMLRAAAVMTLLLCAGAQAATPKSPSGAAAGTGIATFAGGCFWSMDAVFERLEGVRRVTAGFAGGTVRQPSYERVCTGTTGHAETVQIEFDPARISYDELLRVFFAFHDPTTPDRQGYDVGTQYRSVVFTHSPAQQKAVRAKIAELAASGTYSGKIVTQVVPFTAFYPAESYHQNYYDRNSDQPYCRNVIAPKVAKLHKLFAGELKPSM